MSTADLIDSTGWAALIPRVGRRGILEAACVAYRRRIAEASGAATDCSPNVSIGNTPFPGLYGERLLDKWGLLPSDTQVDCQPDPAIIENLFEAKSLN